MAPRQSKKGKQVAAENLAAADPTKGLGTIGKSAVAPLGQEKTMKTKTEVKHTPGPWRVSNCRKENNDKILCPFIEYGNSKTIVPLIAELYYRGDEIQMEADARLIAAAPDLLGAAKEALLYITGDIRPVEDDVVLELQAAIMRAEEGKIK